MRREERKYGGGCEDLHSPYLDAFFKVKEKGLKGV